MELKYRKDYFCINTVTYDLLSEETRERLNVDNFKFYKNGIPYYAIPRKKLRALQNLTIGNQIKNKSAI